RAALPRPGRAGRGRRPLTKEEEGGPTAGPPSGNSGWLWRASGTYPVCGRVPALTRLTTSSQFVARCPIPDSGDTRPVGFSRGESRADRRSPRLGSRPRPRRPRRGRDEAALALAVRADRPRPGEGRLLRPPAPPGHRPLGRSCDRAAEDRPACE